MYEYKVLTERDKRFGGVDRSAVENLLNSHAANGWRLAQSFTAASLWKSMRTEIIIVLERAKGEAGTEVASR